jgi:hypothetical protein
MAGKALRQFIRDFGVPEQLTSDGASEQTGPKTDFMQNVQHHISEPHRPQQNRAESVICEVKRRWFRQMAKRRAKATLGLWYGVGVQSYVTHSELIICTQRAYSIGTIDRRDTRCF